MKLWDGKISKRNTFPFCHVMFWKSKFVACRGLSDFFRCKLITFKIPQLSFAQFEVKRLHFLGFFYFILQKCEREGNSADENTWKDFRRGFLKFDKETWLVRKLYNTGMLLVNCTKLTLMQYESMLSTWAGTLVGVGNQLAFDEFWSAKSPAKWQ